MAKESGKKQGKVGKGNPPKEFQFKPGQSGNSKGRGKGIPNRSTIALNVLKMKGKLPGEILRNLEKMYPEFFKKKGEGWSNEFLATIRLAQKAIIKGDVLAYNVIMDSAYGKARQSLELGVDDTISEVKLTLVKNENSKPTGNNSIPKKLGGVSKKEIQNPDKRGGDGKQQDGVHSPADGNDNAEGKRGADNDSKKDPASPEGNSDEGLPERSERTGGV